MSDLHSSDLNPEALANQIDEALSSDANALFSSGYLGNDPRVDVAIQLANANHPQMSPEMLARVRSRVVSAHRQRMKQRRILRPHYMMVARMAAAFAIIMVFFSATALPALASSVPGDFWYPFKRNLENIELSIASSPTARAQVYLTQAERRLEEAQILLQRKIFNTDLMLDARSSLTSFDRLTAQFNNTLSDRETRVALVTESMSILLQEAEQMQVLSGNQVTALLPTIIPLSTDNTLTDIPILSATMPSTPLITSMNPPLPLAATEVPPALATSITEEPTENTETYTPTTSNIPSEMPTETGQPPIATMYVIENANVRGLPGQNQVIVTVLHQGEATKVIGEDDTGRWWHVRLADGKLGWVAKFLLSANPPPASAGNDYGGNSSDGSNAGGNCDHSGNYCNAPGQTGVLPAQAEGNSNGGGKPDNPGKGNPPSDPGNGHKP